MYSTKDCACTNAKAEHMSLVVISSIFMWMVTADILEISFQITFLYKLKKEYSRKVFVHYDKVLYNAIKLYIQSVVVEFIHC